MVERGFREVEHLGDLVEVGGRIPELGQQAGSHPKDVVDSLGPPPV
jgi:hypothetical protein